MWYIYLLTLAHLKWVTQSGAGRQSILRSASQCPSRPWLRFWRRKGSRSAEEPCFEQMRRVWASASRNGLANCRQQSKAKGTGRGWRKCLASGDPIKNLKAATPEHQESRSTATRFRARVHGDCFNPTYKYRNAADEFVFRVFWFHSGHARADFLQPRPASQLSSRARVFSRTSQLGLNSSLNATAMNALIVIQSLTNRDHHCLGHLREKELDGAWNVF